MRPHLPRYSSIFITISVIILIFIAVVPVPAFAYWWDIVSPGTAYTNKDNTIEFHVTTNAGSPIVNGKIKINSIVSPGGATLVTANPAYTDARGVATFKFRSTASGQSTFNFDVYYPNGEKELGKVHDGPMVNDRPYYYDFKYDKSKAYYVNDNVNMVITAWWEDDGSYIDGAEVRFLPPGPDGATISPGRGNTDSTGKYSFDYRSGTAGQAIIRYTVIVPGGVSAFEDVNGPYINAPTPTPTPTPPTQQPTQSPTPDQPASPSPSPSPTPVVTGGPSVSPSPSPTPTVAGPLDPIVKLLSGLPWLYIVPGAGVVLFCGCVPLYLRSRTNVRVSPKSSGMPCFDATMPVRVGLVNGFGRPKTAKRDTEVELESAGGMLPKNVVIPQGKDSVDVMLTSSGECGVTTIKAKVVDKVGAARVNFLYDQASLELVPMPERILADGRSMANVVIRVKDGKGRYISMLDEQTIALATTLGSVTSPVKLPARASAVTAVVTAGNTVGWAMISATCGALRGEGKVEMASTFVRFCMHCGAPMSRDDEKCNKCGNEPLSGTDTKQCRNCGNVIPEQASFCDRCGVNQPGALSPGKEK